MTTSFGPMQLRSTARRQLTHSSRDFVINQGYIEQNATSAQLSTPHSVLIDTTNMGEDEAPLIETRGHNAPYQQILMYTGILMCFANLMFLAWNCRETFGTDL